MAPTTTRSSSSRVPWLYLLLCGLGLFLAAVVLLSLTIPLYASSRNFPFIDRGTSSAGLDNAAWARAVALRSLRTSPSSVWVVVAPRGVQVSDESGLTTFLPRGSVFLADGDRQFTETGDCRLKLLSTANTRAKWLPCHSLTNGNQRLLVRPLLLDRPVSSNCNEAEFLPQTDFKGGDLPISPVTTSSAGACCGECNAVHKCFAWTFTPDSGQCWLKHGAIKPKPPPPGSASAQAAATITAISGRKRGIANAVKASKCCSGAPVVQLNGSLEERAASFLTSTDFAEGLDGSDPQESSQHVLRVAKSTNKWTQQWPIGTGVFGALVGGTINSEVIPLSVADFFVERMPDDPQNDPPNAAAKNAQRQKSWREARAFLANGDLDAAEGAIGGIEGGSLGMFQYAFDLALSFSPAALKHRKPQEMQSQELPFPPLKMGPKSIPGIKKPPPPQKMRPKLKSSSASEMGRATGLDGLLSAFESHPSTVAQEEAEFGYLYVSDGLLDTRHGVAQNSFLEGRSMADAGLGERRNESVFLHKREWFASEKDQVIVGKISCSSMHGGAACLNAALSFNREANPNGPAPLKVISVERTRNNGAAGASLAEQSFLIKGSLEAEEGLKVFPLQMVGLVVCSLEEMAGLGDSSKERENFSASIVDISPDQGRAIVCNGATSITVVISISLDKSDSAVSHPKAAIQVMEMANLDVVSSASRLGFDELKRRHVNFFSSRMQRMDVSFTSTRAQQVCASRPLSSRFASLGANVKNNGGACEASPLQKPLNKGYDVQLLAQTFQYGRYLMFSSSSRSVSNLQGIWADGPTSAWSGDYHMNINLQMAYWAADSASASEIAAPLVKFIAALSKAGTVTAKDLYGCKSSADAWVAHGFTDGRMDTGVLGASTWSLCVTCGAWLSLYAWEHLLFVHDAAERRTLLVETLLPVLRGVAHFFLEYLFADEHGQLHTGPTTSPENSYEILTCQDTTAICTEAAKMKDVPQNPQQQMQQQQQLQQQLQQLQQQQRALNHLNPKLRVPQLKPMPKPSPLRRRPGFLTFSPAIDSSILRQAANAFSIATKWALLLSERELWDSSSYSAEQAASDRQLASDFVAAVSRLPGRALPVVGGNGLIAEFSLFQKGNASAPAEFVELNGDFDSGHRHFSSMHWLYPNTFLPEKDAALSSSLLAAAHRTLSRKSASGGGHTSWSASWEACLWARLHNPGNAMLAINRLLSRYMAPNGLSLHPPLQKMGGEECYTCFRESPAYVHAATQPNFALVGPERGLALANDAKFQIDGNAGLVAAVCELFLQSHRAGSLHLLPALPAELAEGGHITGLRARGGITVSLAWRSGLLVAVALNFPAWHPWLQGLQEESPLALDGFFVPKEVLKGAPTILSLGFPPGPAARDRLFHSPTACASASSTDGTASISIHSFPCEVSLCVGELLGGGCKPWQV